jgi:hypothetical protein
MYSGNFNEEALRCIEALKNNSAEPKEQMARSSLQSIQGNAEESLHYLPTHDELPDWLKAKITLAADYMSVVRDYLVNKTEG